MTNAAARAEYEAAICKQLMGAKPVPFRKVSLDGWRPRASPHCHENVDTWVRAMRGHRAVRGWVFLKECYTGSGFGEELTAHSVVRDEKGNLFDITPIQDEKLRQSMRFVLHVGDERLFWEFANRSICCPTCQ